MYLYTIFCHFRAIVYEITLAASNCFIAVCADKELLTTKPVTKYSGQCCVLKERKTRELVVSSLKCFTYFAIDHSEFL